MHHMVMGHEEAVSLFEKQAKNGKDGDLKAFAEKTLPTLKEHLKMAKEVAGKVGAEGGAEKANAGKGADRNTNKNRNKESDK
jgi:putative membrane protein